MHADGLQDFQMGRIFPPDKLEMSVRMAGMRRRICLLDCTEPFTPRTRAREGCARRSTRRARVPKIKHDGKETALRSS